MSGVSRSCTKSILPVGRNQKRGCRLWSKPTETKHSIAEPLECCLTLASATRRQYLWEDQSRAFQNVAYVASYMSSWSLSYNNLRSKWLMDAQDEPRNDWDVFSQVGWSQEKHDWGEDEYEHGYTCWTLLFGRAEKKFKLPPSDEQWQRHCLQSTTASAEVGTTIQKIRKEFLVDDCHHAQKSGLRE